MAVVRLPRLASGLTMFLQLGALQVLGDGLVEEVFARKDEVAVRHDDVGGDRLAGKQVVTEIDRPKLSDRGAVPCQPALRALRSQSCFSAPSCGAMNSGGSGMTFF